MAAVAAWPLPQRRHCRSTCRGGAVGHGRGDVPLSGSSHPLAARRSARSMALRISSTLMLTDERRRPAEPSDERLRLDFDADGSVDPGGELGGDACGPACEGATRAEARRRGPDGDARPDSGDGEQPEDGAPSPALAVVLGRARHTVS